jgi:hypothetical protein
MKREDFIEFRESFIKSCERIVEDNGVCFNVNSCNCPFSAFNSLNGKSCSENGYHESLLNSAKEFIELYSTINVNYKNDMEN